MLSSWDPCKLLLFTHHAPFTLKTYCLDSAAIMVFDFWLIHGRKYDALSLYQYDSIYHYWEGVNWRAVVAFLTGVTPSIPGLINSVNSNINVGVGVHPYQFGWILGFVGTSLVYCILMYLFPPRETFIERAVLPDEIYDSTETIEGVPASGEYDKGVSGTGEEGMFESQQAGEKKSFRAWANSLL